MVGGEYAEMTHPNPKSCSKCQKFLNPTFYIWVQHSWLGGVYAEMTHTNPKCKSCSKCHKMPKSNFLFLGATFMVGGYAEMTHPNPESYSKMPKSNISF